MATGPESSGSNKHKLEGEVSQATYERLLDICKWRNLGIGEVIDNLVKQTTPTNGANHSSRTNASNGISKGVFQPQTHLREAAIDLSRTALLFIDLQNFSCHREGACHQGQANDSKLDYWWQRNKDAQQVWQQLQTACRHAGIEVMFTVMESLTADGRDRSLDYKISGFHIPPNSFDSQVLECIRPGADEIVIPKTSSSVFTTTNIDTVLRNLDVKNLILAGALTDQCVESAVRDACDLNYLVTLITDGCVTYSRERHENSLAAIKGYCRQRTAQELVEEIRRLQGQSE